jgi:hypothetical protein
MKLWHTLLVVPSRPTIRRRLDKVRTTILPVLSHRHPIPTMPTLRIQTPTILQHKLLLCTHTSLPGIRRSRAHLLSITTTASSMRRGVERKKHAFAMRHLLLLSPTHTKRRLSLVKPGSSSAKRDTQLLPIGPRQHIQPTHLATTLPIRPILPLTWRLTCSSTPTMSHDTTLTCLEATDLSGTRRETDPRTRRLPAVIPEAWVILQAADHDRASADETMSARGLHRGHRTPDRRLTDGMSWSTMTEGRQSVVVDPARSRLAVGRYISEPESGKVRSWQRNPVDCLLLDPRNAYPVTGACGPANKRKGRVTPQFLPPPSLRVLLFFLGASRD